MNYTKGETAGGWIYIHSGKTAIAIVHPKHIDKFLAVPGMYEALKATVQSLANIAVECGWSPSQSEVIALGNKALAKAEGRENAD